MDRELREYDLITFEDYLNFLGISQGYEVSSFTNFSDYNIFQPDIDKYINKPLHSRNKDATFIINCDGIKGSYITLKKTFLS